MCVPPSSTQQQQQQSGNIDLTNRPKVSNPDGSYSTVRTIGMKLTEDGTLISLR
jgi:hypothetical protein